jgi:multidrug resistance efflux pump
MDKDKLPPIPTPASQRWREFRIQWIPFLVFIGVLVGIVYLWRNYVQPVGMIGFVETNAVNVTSLQDGLLTDLKVERFQVVTVGQEVGVVVNTDPELLRLQIATVEADLELMRERLMVDHERTKQGVEQMHAELNIQKVTQAKDKANLFLYSNDFVRAQSLLKDKSISEAQFDAAKARYEETIAAIQQRESSIVDLERSIGELQPKNRAAAPDPVDAAVKAKANELQGMLKPVSLKSPINGMVSMIHHLKGERILRGTPIVTITDPETRRIVGYVRQPVSEMPTTNDFVQIITRSLPRQLARGSIVRVGAQMEPINPALLSADTKRMEVGLPILVSVPPGVRLVPGEFVNLYIDKR